MSTSHYASVASPLSSSPRSFRRSTSRSPRTPGRTSGRSPRHPARIAAPIFAESPVVPEPPRKKRATVARLTDDEIWEKSDEEIIRLDSRVWTSPTYRHYNISLFRHTATRTLYHIFRCKHGNGDHVDQRRERKRSGDGTSNLKKTADACDKRRGVSSGSTTALTVGQYGPYSAAKHRALIALWCAASHRPARMVQDKYHRMLVELLRPGTHTISEATVSRDIQYLHQQLGVNVKRYFMERGRHFHLVIDGWTNPVGVSDLGVMIIWHDQGQIHVAVLDFIKLTRKHSGKYLGGQLDGLLRKWGIHELVMLLNMDNAGNCDTTARELAILNPAFLGERWRLRCFLHILNLMAKAVLMFFHKTYKRKKQVTASTGNKRKRGQSAAAAAVAQAAAEEEVLLEFGGNTDDPDELELADAQEADNTEASTSMTAEHPDQLALDDKILKSLKEVAIARMDRDHNVRIPSAETDNAIKVMPKVAGLARKLHDNSSLGTAFQEQVATDRTLDRDTSVLVRRVATRWNADLDCLSSHIYLKNPVERFTGQSSHGCGAYRLTVSQWELAEQLEDLLLLFKPLTLKFSSSGLTLIVDVLDEMEKLESSLSRVRDSTRPGTPPIIRVAAHAALLVRDKYHSLLDKCEAYAIAIAMSPHKKLAWFRAHGYSDGEIAEIRQLVMHRYMQSYSSQQQALPLTNTSTSSPVQRVSSWASDSEPTEPMAADNIEAYLNSPPISQSEVETAGGCMSYWYKQEQLRPSVAYMAMDFLSAPATSVEVERQFSVGRRAMSFMQHNMSHDVFRARMALGSWEGTPLFPDWSVAAHILEKHML